MNQHKEYGDIFGGRCSNPGTYCTRAEKELETLRYALYMSDLEFDLLERQHEDELEQAYQDGHDDASADEDAAYDNGYTMGHDEGYNSGYAEGYAEGEEAGYPENE